MNRLRGLKQAKKRSPRALKKHPKSYLANLATMRLLVTVPEFQAAVAETRRILGIPKDGLFKIDIIIEQPHFDRRDNMSSQ